MMNDSDATGKLIWERMIKQNMVPLKLGGRQSTSALDPKKNSAVEVHFETRYFLYRCQLSKMEPAVARSSDTFDIAGEEFLILKRNPALNTHQLHMPWKTISEIVFLDT